MSYSMEVQSYQKSEALLKESYQAFLSLRNSVNDRRKQWGKEYKEKKWWWGEGVCFHYLKILYYLSVSFVSLCSMTMQYDRAYEQIGEELLFFPISSCNTTASRLCFPFCSIYICFTFLWWYDTIALLLSVELSIHYIGFLSMCNKIKVLFIVAL